MFVFPTALGPAMIVIFSSKDIVFSAKLRKFQSESVSTLRPTRYILTGMRR